MKKNKYQRATKNTKKEVKTEFFQTDFGKDLKKRLNRLVIYSILLTLCAIYYIIDGIINEFNVSNILIIIVTLLFAILFLYGRYYVIVKNCNKYMINNPNKAKRRK